MMNFLKGIFNKEFLIQAIILTAIEFFITLKLHWEVTIIGYAIFCFVFFMIWDIAKCFKGDK